jgi:hypothetical protein
MSRSQRMVLVDRESPEVSLSRQCSLLGAHLKVSRGFLNGLVVLLVTVNGKKNKSLSTVLVNSSYKVVVG